VRLPAAKVGHVALTAQLGFTQVQTERAAQQHCRCPTHTTNCHKWLLQQQSNQQPQVNGAGPPTPAPEAAPITAAVGANQVRLTHVAADRMFELSHRGLHKASTRQAASPAAPPHHRLRTCCCSCQACPIGKSLAPAAASRSVSCAVQHSTSRCSMQQQNTHRCGLIHHMQADSMCCLGSVVEIQKRHSQQR
jgi:hypothetical protein